MMVRSTVASFPLVVQIINVCMLSLGTLLLYSVKVKLIRTMRVSIGAVLGRNM
jgi:hypothetical protein